MRLQSATRREAFFAILAAVSMMLAMLLLALPAGAQATSAGLSIKKEGPTRVEPGERFDYVLTVSNAAGAKPASNVTVEDQLPSGVTFEDFEAPAGVNCDSVAGTVTCTVPTLEAGRSETITLKVRASGQAGEITNRARASSADDPKSPVTSNEVKTTVAPRLVIDKLDDPDPVRIEGLLLYTLRVQNQSEEPAEGVAVTDELPLDAVDFVTVESRDFDCRYTAGVVQCNADHALASGEIAKVEIVVEPEKAGTIKNTAYAFVQGVRGPLAEDTETTTVIGGGSNPDDPTDPDGPTTPDDSDIPEGDQCSPVVERGTENPIGVISGTTEQGFIFTNTYRDTLPLRVVYATSSADGSLNISAKARDGGKSILNKTIQGKKRGAFKVDTKSGATYDVAIQPEDQGYAIQFEIGVGPEKCTDASSLDPPSDPGGNDGTNGNNGANSNNGANDVIDNTVSDNPLPNTGGPSLLGLAVVTFSLAVSGASVITVRRRDR
jgi:uncharacterized repeat protein (TIGR01451 family)